MRVLLVGNGNREHALAWKISTSPLCTELFSFPSSDLLRKKAASLKQDGSFSYSDLAQFVKKEKIEFVVCGPEKPLAEGLVNTLGVVAPGCHVLGPRAEAAELEASKTFAKKLMKKAGIPTASYEEVSSYEGAWQEGLAAIRKKGGVVLKADGLASGKGVFVCHSEEELQRALEHLKELFSAEKPKILVEEELVGREFSYFSLVHDQYHTPLGCAVDFKRLEEGDLGPNTGGMGAYTPVPWLPLDWESRIKDEIVDPLLLAMKEEGVSYQGVLYCGLMLTDSGIKVIEFNVRLGDPEAQALLVNDKRDYMELFLESFEKKVGYTPFVETRSKAIGAVITSQDYPYCLKEEPQFDFALEPSFFENKESPYVFGSSLLERNGLFYPQKGRVMTVVSQSDNSFAEAKEKLSLEVERVRRLWPESRWRPDIASKVIQEESYEKKELRASEGIGMVRSQLA